MENNVVLSDMECSSLIGDLLWKSKAKNSEDLFEWFAQSRIRRITDETKEIDIVASFDEQKDTAIVDIINKAKLKSDIKSQLLAWMASGRVVIQKIINIDNMSQDELKEHFGLKDES